LYGLDCVVIRDGLEVCWCWYNYLRAFAWQTYQGLFRPALTQQHELTLFIQDLCSPGRSLSHWVRVTG
jgi:hypothetical protein